MEGPLGPHTRPLSRGLNTSSPLQCRGHPIPLLLWGKIFGEAAPGRMLGRRLPGQRQPRMAGCSRDVQGRGKREPGASPGDLKGQKSVRSTAPGRARL